MKWVMSCTGACWDEDQKKKSPHEALNHIIGSALLQHRSGTCGKPYYWETDSPTSIFHDLYDRIS